MIVVDAILCLLPCNTLKTLSHFELASLTCITIVIVFVLQKLQDEGRDDDDDEDDYSGGSDRDYSDDDSDDDDGGGVPVIGFGAAPIHIPRALNVNIPVCRQCQGYDGG